MDSIFLRRSIRKYKPQEVNNEQIENILKAAMQAPSAGNQQSWEFIVVKNRDTLKKLSGMSPYSKMIENASCAIIVLSNKNELKYPENWEQDLGACTQNILLQTVNEGLGAVWLGVAPLESRMKYLEELFSLPKYISPFAVIPIGYPDGKNAFIDRYDESKVHNEQYKYKKKNINI